MSTAPAPTADGYLSHRQILVVLGGLMAGMFLAALDQSILGTALPAITSDLGGLDKLSWVVTTYLLTSTASTPLWGKISDLYGRRPMFQAAIIIFVAGSMLSALAQNIEMLIGFRAVQGLGAGGLFALALATIGDVIPPRQRGRYQGYFGAVFGTSSVLGPVLGGWFTDGPGWRWVFWINVPIGLAALVVTSMALKLHHVRRDHKIDYVGAAVIVAAVTSLLLYTAWAGPDLGWGSPTAVALIVAGAAFAVLFVLVELRATEPIIPMALFRNSIFSLSVVFVFVVGFAMFGALVFIPLFLQIVGGMTPTMSGLAMLPMVVGIFSTSISSGQIMSRTGRYKIFPILGAATVAVALFLLSRLDADSPYWVMAIAMYVMGAGLGLQMQILITVVQNSVDRRHIGTATSSVTFFRSMGGAFGTAVIGAIMGSRLGVHLAERLPSLPAGQAPDTNNVDAIKALPAVIREPVVDAFALSLHDAFLATIPVVLVAFGIAWFIKEKPLADRQPAPVEAPEGASV
ncbi:MAG: DHA2 family efflux MFS transporter permease subunit [Propionibacteriales bacterium]|nr:DHA2 family efflux MFS transporter permease subunit [Propionibacteriales bacterium]